MKKKLFVIVTAVAMSAMLAACGGQSNGSSASSGESKDGPSEQTAVAEAPADGTVYECVAALHTNAGGIEDQTVQKFGQLLSEKTDGHVVVSTFAGGALGTEQENLTQIKTNEIQFALFGDVFLTQLLQDYNATSIPFVFENIDESISYWDSISDVVDEKVKSDGNMYIVGREWRAPRQLTANKAIEHPSDLAGFKLRVPETKFYLDVWGSLGALTTPVNWSEVFTALQTNVVDGQENPIETYYQAGLCEVQSHTMLTNHINTFYTWAVNCDFYDSLPDEYKKAFDEAAQEALEECNSTLYSRQDETIEKMKAEGHTFVEVDQSEFRDAAMDAIKACADTLAPEAKEAVYKKLGE